MRMGGEVLLSHDRRQSRPRVQAAVFTGAGASKPLNYPLTKELLPIIRKKLRDRTLFDDEAINGRSRNTKDRKKLERLVYGLLPGLDKANDQDLPLITELLSIVDHSIQTSSALIPGLDTGDMVEFRRLLEYAIFCVIEDDEEETPQDKEHAKRVGKEMVQLLLSLQQDASVGIISTNYDMSIEKELFALHEHGNEIPAGDIARDFDFGFSWREAEVSSLVVHHRPHDPRYHLYKLHGSVNWLRCNLCEQTYVNQYGPMTHQAFRNKIDDSNTCHCSHARLKPTLIAPSAIRDIREAGQQEVWRNALELLRTTPTWIIIGYSFPYEDIGIRSLFLRACNGHWRDEGPTIVVVEQGDAARSRYKLFFPHCHYYAGGIEHFLEEGMGKIVPYGPQPKADA